MVQYEIIIEGRVQGVGFRYFVQKRAAELHITGWVKNRVDGNVQVMAQGDARDMEIFLDQLRTGPSLARVIRLTGTQIPVSEEFIAFKVRY